MESIIQTQFNIDNNQKKLDTSKACTQCKKTLIDCDGNRPCKGCVSMGKPGECTTDSKVATVPTKRGYKTHVPSACVNCKNAHLACDVSRPCRRCVSLNKADTCHDMQHKKRGRPKLKDKKPYSSSNEHSYEVLYGTIETPAITMKMVPTPATPPKQQTPRKIQQQQQSTTTISFIHEPIESFRSQKSLYNNNNNNNNNNNSSSHSHHNSNSTNGYVTNNTSLDPPLPVVRLSANPQPFVHELPTSNTAVSTTTNGTIANIATNRSHYSSIDEPLHIIEETASNHQNTNTLISLQPPRPTTTINNNNNNNSGSITTTTATTMTSTPILNKAPSNDIAITTASTNITNNTTTTTTTNTTTTTPTSSVFSTPTTSNNNAAINVDDNNVTIIMSMEICCARVSDQVIKAWGYYPQELAHRSFYDFISPKDSDRLARLHRLLLDNATEIFKKNNMNMSFLPATERSTSEKFSSTNPNQLKIVANGARSFSDTIHIKQRSGDFELYEVLVHIGGGLGADLYDVSSFSKQYIVAQFRKYQYEVSQKTPYSANEEEYINQTPSTGFYAFSPMLSPVTPSSLDSPGKMMEQHQHQQQPQQYIEQERMSSLSEIFNFDDNSKEQHERSLTPLANNKQTPFMKGSHDPKKESSSGLPKFNVAPLTDAATPKYHTLPIGGRLFKASETSSPLSNRFPPIRLTASSVQVTHPTQQYFLQTSSSTLNAAASAAQSISRRSAPFGPPVDATPVNTASSRKIEMSIRSLLC